MCKHRSVCNILIKVSLSCLASMVHVGSDYGMGDAFADCLAMASSATGLLRQLETLILRNNKLSDTVSTALHSHHD